MQRTRWIWSEEPFSYLKLCIIAPVLVIAAVPIMSYLGWDKWLPSSEVLNVAIVGTIALGAYLFFAKVIWYLLPSGVRSHIPYDRKEALEKKGDVRSSWGLLRLFFKGGA